MLKNKKIVLGITGSIAAYKAIYLIRTLIKEGAIVKVIMTPAAKDFVTPLTLSTISKNPVLTELFAEDTWANHVELGRWADVMLIAPLSCNTLAKMAIGICDNLLLATYLSATCPVIVAPAMDEDMWMHPSTKSNLDKINSFGNLIIPVGKGELASGLFGEGRMAEPEDIIRYLNEFFQAKKNSFAGKKVLVTAGPTYEPIDPVRFIGNYSSGKMGIAIANELAKRGAVVTLVIGPHPENNIHPSISIKNIRTAAEMLEATEAVFSQQDIGIFAAAIADYTPIEVADEKIKKKEERFTIELKKTTDVLAHLGAQKGPNQCLVGFALETQNEKQHALEKLRKKNLDLIVLNSLKDEGAGFGVDTNKITIFDKDEKEYQFTTKSKEAVANDIIDTIFQLFYE